jgi:hypothetical protein
MLLTNLPFDYALLADPGDRVRKTRGRTSATRVRRPRRAKSDKS